MDSTIRSEAIEPVATYLIARWWAKCEEAKKSEKGGDLENALVTFWHGVRALNRVAIACTEAKHFSIAISNEMRRVALYIEECIGINPIAKEHPLFPTRG